MRKGGRAQTRVGESSVVAKRRRPQVAATCESTHPPTQPIQPTNTTITIPLQNPDGLYWRPMPSAFVPEIRKRAKSSKIFRRMWFWALVTTASLALLLLLSS